MKIAVVGLGRMGFSVAHRALLGGHEVVGFDFSAERCDAARAVGATIAPDLQTVARQARVIWLMVPAGAPVDAVIAEMLAHLHKGDIIIDGGNSKFTDSIRRAKELAQQEIIFLDCGTSGGLRGGEIGFSLMIGGDTQAYAQLQDLWVALAAPNGFGHVGPSGAGHYVKMVHNGIEYGIMQAYAEGLHLIKDGSYKDAHIDLAEVTRIWNNGGIIRSFLLELAQEIVTKDQDLSTISGAIEESGMGSWTVQEAHNNKIPVTVIEESLAVRARSRATGGNYATKVVAMLRNAFGGHSVQNNSRSS